MVQADTAHLKQLYINGKKTLSDKVRLLGFPEERPFVFESMRSYGGKIFRLNRHLERLIDSAKTIGLFLPRNAEELKADISAALKSHSKADLFLRLAVDEIASYIVILKRARPAWVYEHGLDLTTTVTRRNAVNSETPQVKSNAFLNNVFAILDPPQSAAHEALFLDRSGYMTEGTAWNLFVAKEKKLFTPEAGFLPGVTRQFVIECAVRKGISVLETCLTRHDLWTATEAFLTNTSGEVIPLRSLDGRAIGRDIPGRVTRELMDSFHQELKKELKAS